MPSFSATVRADAPPAAVWPLVADLSRHGEWAADPLTVTQAGDGYESVATSKGKEFRARLTVLESAEPRRFAFRATDATGTYEHVFTLEPDGAGTRITRVVTATALTPGQRALYYVALATVRKPSARTALERLASAASGERGT
ncbi:MAG TPA: SRPBCC family protein [Mycobacteriales bacterium]|nr:SRPBCC family protein [Mycobacteriales bacterium]